MAEVWEIVLTCVCIVLSGLFSGLTLGLLSLDLTDLRVYIDSGTPQEKKHANRIFPIRKRGNYLLVSLLIGNTSVNSALSILSSSIFNGAVGFGVSTVVILYLGEIIPQAVCHKYGLIIGAYTSPLVYFLMFVTFPIAWPTSRVLNWVLGSETDLRYTKREIKSLVTIHGEDAEGAEFSRDETAVLGSAMDFYQKKVQEVMTPLEKVFMFDVQTPLDFTTMTLLFQSGHSRVPVYDGERTNIVGVIFAKDLILLDPDDDILVRTVMNFFDREVRLVFEDMSLGALLNEFKSGRGHLAVVKRVNSTGEGDPFYETVGLVTLEDLIEELIGSEIVDETDVYEDNVRHTRVHRDRRFDPNLLKLFDSSARRQETLTGNELNVVQSFLSRNVEQFSPQHITDPVLRKLLRHCEIVEYTEGQQLALRFSHTNHVVDGKEDDDVGLQKTKPMVLYQKGVEASDALLVLQGRLRLTIGEEEFTSEVGPWTLLAKNSLASNFYEPDFSAETLELPVRLVKISRQNYQNAKRLSKNSDILRSSYGVPPKVEDEAQHPIDAGASSRGSVNGMHANGSFSHNSEEDGEDGQDDGFVDPPNSATVLQQIASGLHPSSVADRANQDAVIAIEDTALPSSPT